jgi:23S rRNA pseudouridine1911/1915/1917 synthase
MQVREVRVDEDNEGKRLDVYLAEALSERFSRSQIKKWIEQGGVKIKDREVSAHYKVKQGDKIHVEMVEEVDDGTRAENIPLEIFYEDEDLLLVNKPAGMVVHPAHGNPTHTLVNALLYHVQKLSGVSGASRPGIVHRLDKGTSGILIVAKNDRTHAFLAEQFKSQSIDRFYRVVVKGVVQHQEGIIEEPVGRAFLNRRKIMVKPSGGKDALTYYTVMKRYAKATLLEIKIQTGRTHQIRVHMRHLDHPVIGDEIYGVVSPYIDRQAVHAFSLAFTHPKTKKRMYFECPLPADMQDLLKKLEQET